MHCFLLGALEVRIGDQPVEIGGPRLRALLARLALNPGRTIPVDTLVDALWGERAPAGAPNALQSLVSRLRRSLGDPALIGSTPAGYALHAEGTDVTDFERLLGEGRTALHSGDPGAAAATLAEALRLWRGPALVDVADAPFAPAATRRLDELRLAATEDRVAADLELGRQAEVVAEIDGLVQQHPLRERLRGQHITALYRTGRQADALASYEAARELLAEELGIDPSAELQEIQLAALRGELALPAGTAVRRTNLRAQVTSFVGRTEDVAAIAELLGQHRLVTLVGPGGAGKTRLATVVGAGLQDRMPDGVWMVELAPVSSPADVVQAVLSALGLRERALLESAPDSRDASEKLVAALANKRLLILLDNCEHLVGPAAELVDTVLARCPAVRVLATSREPLAVTGEAQRPVLPLRIDGADGAVRLFAERAAAVRPDFQLATCSETVHDICQRLDGMPLAIELAAARLKSLTPNDLAARLDNRFRLLTGGSRAALPRHQTLRAVVDWSWELLEKPERVLARRLSVFPGGATLRSAEKVCADDELPVEDVVDLMSALVDKSLLQPVNDAESQGRYRMLETIRAYGQEQLLAAGEETAVRAAHAAYFLHSAQAAEPHLRAAEQLVWMHRVRIEHDNMLAALRFYTDTQDADGAVRLCGALAWYWSLGGYRAEASNWLAEAVAIPGESPPVLRALAYSGLAMLRAGAGDLIGAKWAMGAALLILHRHPELYDSHPFAGLIEPIAAILVPQRASRIPRELDRARRLADPWTRATALMMHGHWAENEGRAVQSEEYYTAALEEFRVIGDRWGMASTLESLSQIREYNGDLVAVRDIQQQALALLVELEAYEDVAQGLTMLATRQARLGELEQARASVEQARDLARRYADVETVLFVECAASEVSRRAGDLVAARTSAEYALAEAKGATLMPAALSAIFLTNVGALDVVEGLAEQARDRLLLAAATAWHFGDRGMVAGAVDGLAAAELLNDDAERAATLLGIAVTSRGLPDRGNPDVVAATEQTRAALSPAVFQAAYDRGAGLSYAAAMEFVGVADVPLDGPGSGPAPVRPDSQ